MTPIQMQTTSHDGTERRHSQVSQYEILLESHTEEEIRRYEELKKQIQELKESVDAIHTMWNQAKGILYFMKWVAGIGGSVGAWLLFFKDHWK